MEKDKQINEMAEVIKSSLDDLGSGNFNFTGYEIAVMFAKALYNAGYRKIYDDLQRQCTCYALGCQMAEELKREVAREIFEEIEKIRLREIKRCETMREKEYTHLQRNYWEGGEHSLRQLTYWFAELKKKYESEKDK